MSECAVINDMGKTLQLNGKANTDSIYKDSNFSLNTAGGA